jgi:hypothetical protein
MRSPTAGLALGIIALGFAACSNGADPGIGGAGGRSGGATSAGGTTDTSSATGGSTSGATSSGGSATNDSRPDAGADATGSGGPSRIRNRIRLPGKPFGALMLFRGGVGPAE